MIRLAVLLVLFAGLSQAGEPPVQEAPASTIGYPSVTEALAALRGNPSISESEKEGWLIFSDGADYVLWSFTPYTHPAHPAAVRRQAIEKDGAVYIEISVLCQSTKESCDQLVRDFQHLNERMRQALSPPDGQTR